MSAPVGIQKTGRTRRAALRRAALLRAQGRTRPLCTQPLGDVVAERGPNRIFNRLRGNTEGSVVVARPAIPGEVGVLNPPAKSAFGALVKLMPEPEGSFHNDASVPGTGTAAGWCELIGRRIFRADTRVICEWRAVSTDLVQLERSSCRGGNRRSRGRSWDSRSFRDGNAVVSLIRSAPSVLGTEVGINIEVRGCMELQFPESMSRADQGVRAVGAARSSGQLG